MYEDLFDDKHRMIRTYGLDPSTARPVQSGEKEGDILCGDCDNKRLGSLEDYAKRALYSGQLNDSQKISAQNQLHPDGELTSTYCENIDYAKFKLFLLSLLWRASISKLDFFEKVSLGPKEEVLRKMIYENDPQSQLDFPCMVSSFRSLHRQMTSGIISSPLRTRSEKGTRYIFQIGQLVLMFFVSEADTPDFLQDAAITPNNKMRIVHFSNEQGENLMKAYFGETMTKALYLGVNSKK